MSKVLILIGYTGKEAQPEIVINTKKEAMKYLKEEGYKHRALSYDNFYYERQNEPTHARIDTILEIKDIIKIHKDVEKKMNKLYGANKK